MTQIAGGLRARMIHDSLFHLVQDSLTKLGWFDSDRHHQPMHMLARPPALDDEVQLNSVAIAEGTLRDEPAELGSELTDDTWTYYVDFYAEDEAMGMHVIGDVRDILRGKLHSIGRTGSVLYVFDWRTDPPSPLFTCDITAVETDRAQNFPHAWQRYWFSCRCDIVDTYGSDDTDATWVDFGDLTWEDLV